MGGNSVGRTTRVTTKPTQTAREKKINKVLQELKELTPTQRKNALAALRSSGNTELADALQALLPKGTRPPERNTPVRGGGK